jgi:hypothetical protein
VFVSGTSARELEGCCLNAVFELPDNLPAAHDVAAIDVQARNHAHHRTRQFHDLMRFDDTIEFGT